MENPDSHRPNGTTRQAKLSKPQQDVLEKMSNGWQLGMSMGYRTRYWLQKGDCGRGGDTQEVNAHTAHGLRNKGLITIDETRFPLQTFRLSRGVDSTTA